MGRPTKYEPKFHNDWAWSLAIQGATDREIAQAMGISVSTLNKWKLDFPEFSESLKAGKESADAHIERSLFRLAMGITVKKRRVTDRTVGNQTIQTDKQGEEYEVPPNATAIIFWLKNRQPQKWRDRKDVEVNTTEIDKTPSGFMTQFLTELSGEETGGNDGENT